MSEDEIRIQNIALLYNIHKEIHPDDSETTLAILPLTTTGLFQKSKRHSVNLTYSERLSFSNLSLFFLIAFSRYLGSSSASPCVHPFFCISLSISCVAFCSKNDLFH